MVWPPRLELNGLLGLNNLSKDSVPLFDIGQPHPFPYTDGLQCDSFPFSYNLRLGGDLRPHSHVVMCRQRCLDDNHMRCLGDVYRNHLAMNPIGPSTGCRIA